MIHDYRLSVALVLASTFAVACSGTAQTSVEQEPAQIAEALERDNGGIGRTNEAPGFGDPSIDSEVPMSDESADEDSTLGGASPGSRLYRLALVWGHMPPPREVSADPTPPAAADFSGSIALDRGAIGVARTIRFDGADHLERRDSVNEVRFVSRTAPHVDGLLVTVRVPEGASPTVKFRTSTLDTDIDLDARETREGAAKRAPDGVNGLMMLAYEDSPGCASGFIVGRWREMQGGVGAFHGRVTGDRGLPLGHLRGIFGHSRRADKDVFFGKYINAAGEFRGLLAGEYGAGQFRGIWGVHEPRNAGVLAGRYGDGRVSDDGKGVFLGHFQEKCPR